MKGGRAGGWITPDRGRCRAATSWAKMPKGESVTGGILTVMGRMKKLQIGCLSGRTVAETSRMYRSRHYWRIMAQPLFSKSVAFRQQRPCCASGEDIAREERMSAKQRGDEAGISSNVGRSFFCTEAACAFSSPAEPARHVRAERAHRRSGSGS